MLEKVKTVRMRESRKIMTGEVHETRKPCSPKIPRLLFLTNTSMTGIFQMSQAVGYANADCIRFNVVYTVY